MRKNKYILILILISAFVLGTCSSDDDWGIKFCEECGGSTPWRVETLDLGLPCFKTEEACLEWAASHGYGDQSCNKCD
jgi:hypothetical protein